METRQLRYFVAVAEERHFGRAALRLHMAQPPLSHQIKQLEEQLGTQLLVRTTRKVELTPAGELLLVRARGLLAEIDQLGQDVKLVGQGASGVLRVGVVGSATYRLMPRIVETAGSRLPGLKLHVLGEMLTPALEEALEENRIDVAVLRPPVRSGELELKFLEQDELVAALPEDHPLASRGSLELADLAGEKFVSYPRTSAVCGIFMDACRRVGFRPRIVQEASETSTLLAFVASGMGLALVPMTRRVFALQGTVLRPLRDAPAVDLALAWRRGSDSPLINNFVDLFETSTVPEGTARED
jgi:DNA-binding transcriptional LysR family regulator